MVLVLVGLYGGVGWIANHRLKGLNGTEALPHVDTWREVLDLVHDGVRFSQARFNARSGYTAVSGEKASQEKSASLVRKEVGKGAARNPGKESKRSSKAAKQSSRRGGGTKTKLGDAREDDQAAEGAADATVKSSPSGAGGRWVHVPN